MLLHPDVDDGLCQAGGCLDRLRRCLEVPLRGNQVHQLFGDVDIRAFQRTRQDVTEAFGTRLADLRRTGNGCFRVGRVTDLLQTVLVVEVRDNNLSKRVVLTVGVVGANGFPRSRSRYHPVGRR